MNSKIIFNFLKENKTLLLFFTSFFLFFLFSNEVQAQTLYAQQVAYSPTFNLKLEDDSQNTLELSTNTSLSNPDLWQASGVTIGNFEFKSIQYDGLGQMNTYELKQGGKYGESYTVNGFRFQAGSKISLIEYDASVFDGDDKVELLIRTNGTNNILTIDKLKTDIKSGDTDLDFEEESFLEKFNLNLKIAVDLKNGEEIKTVQATITGNKNGFNFVNGLQETIQEAANRQNAGLSSDDIEIIPPEETTQDSVQDTVVRDVPTVGFSKSATGLKKPTAGQIKGISSERNLEVFIVNITNWLLSFVAAIAVIMLVYGGYLWITDQGDESSVEKAKKIIMGSVVGILLIISAYTIVNTIINLETNITDGCGVGVDIGAGTNIDLNCNIEDMGSEIIGAGAGGVIGNVIGQEIGDDTGGLVGALLGGAVGALGGGWRP